MKLLLDTHTFLWWDSEPDRLSAAALRDLPLHHGDPFDRLLIAQANVEGAF